jgi:hypothetical protein
VIVAIGGALAIPRGAGQRQGRARYRFDTPRRLQFCNRFGETGGTRTRGV